MYRPPRSDGRREGNYSVNQILLRALTDKGITCAYGVPDSVLQDELLDLGDAGIGVEIAVNEGAAMARAVARYLVTGEPALVFTQNSGLGNLLNPLTALAVPEAYRVPTVLLVGNREGSIDEPQHLRMGKITIPLLELCGFRVIHSDSPDLAKVVAENDYVAILFAEKKTRPCPSDGRDGLSYVVAIDEIVAQHPHAFYCGTTGYLSRLLYARAGGARSYLHIGGMGHVSAVAQEIASLCPGKEILCFDGDGSLLMHLGNLVPLRTRPSNFHYFLFDNGQHLSVGGGATAIAKINVEKLAAAAGFTGYVRVSRANELGQAAAGTFYHLVCNSEVPSKIIRPEESPRERVTLHRKILCT